MSMVRGAVAAGFVVLAIAAAGSARWPVAPGRVAASLNSAFGPASHVRWSAPQSAAFSALPWPSLRIVDARLDSAGGANVVSAPEARISLSPIDLVSGRFAATGVTLFQPTIALDLDRTPFARRLDAAEAAAALNALAPLGSLRLTNGVVRLTDRTRGLDTVIDGLQGSVEGLQPGARLRINLSGVWRDAPLVVSGSLDDPQGAALGRPSAASVAIVSMLGGLAFKGAVTAGASPGALGELSVSSHALAEVARLIGARPPPGIRIADLALSGTVKAKPGDVTFDEATVTSGGQTLQGALRLARVAGRLSISGSLDTQRLTLAPLFGRPPSLFAGAGGWSDRAFSIRLPTDFDLDLRLSADTVDAYGVALADVAASALLKDGVLTANLVEAVIYGGRLECETRLASGDSLLQIAARAKLAGADLAAAASDFGWSDMTGRGDAEFAVETSGRSPAEAVAALSGKASLEIADGVVSGVNLEEALRRSQRRPLDVAKDMRSGGTAFERASVSLVIGQGVAHLVDGALESRGVAADLQGAVDLVGRSVKVRLNAAQAQPTGATPPDAAHLSLAVEGPWDDPTIRAVDETDAEPSIPAP